MILQENMYKQQRVTITKMVVVSSRIPVLSDSDPIEEKNIFTCEHVWQARKPKATPCWQKSYDGLINKREKSKTVILFVSSVICQMSSTLTFFFFFSCFLNVRADGHILKEMENSLTEVK